MKYYTPGTKEDFDIFRTTTEIEMALKEETNAMARISTQQLGKALKTLGFNRDNRYDSEKEYPLKAYYLKFRQNII
ncbi:hypothetical protein [Arachidicoccus sp.]|uniref:hypothetical protein n=1 Tax=Arachidicoccus sp. TaxID=1872624 RepID=UPI003D1C99F0